MNRLRGSFALCVDILLTFISPKICSSFSFLKKKVFLLIKNYFSAYERVRFLHLASDNIFEASVANIMFLLFRYDILKHKRSHTILI